MVSEENLMRTKLSLATRLLGDEINCCVAEVSHLQTGMPVKMQAMLGIQVLARVTMLITLEIMEVQIITLTKLLLSSLRWLQCSPKLM